MAAAAVRSFQRALSSAHHVCVLTGAGISAESGVPTFRGPGGLWRQHHAAQLATPEAFAADPALVWEFYSYRRGVVADCAPNKGHLAVTALQRRLATEGKRFGLLTQNVDRLHHQAGLGPRDVTELHGSLWLVKRVGEEGFVESPGRVWEDRTHPIVPALAGRGAPDADSAALPPIPVGELPHSEDGRLLRPAVVWFGEQLDTAAWGAAAQHIGACDLLVVVGTSSAVYPAAGFAEEVRRRGVPVAEFNLEQTALSGQADYSIRGAAGDLLPDAFGVDV
eukprot:TRINITY_DN40109_c0_g1_i1.p1 TRINITY_DN40109_c0_g1~~TRINITY_DN40109_c0_g1_i1.p1  ORF type:complete len:300 (+),score=102.95 TRINITY_DN40109_c0_g1_i1:66-902(+)